MGGLVNGRVYIVKVIDSKTVKLVDSTNVPAAPLSFTGANVAGNTITIANNAFQNGQAVTYTAPSATSFSTGSVDELVTNNALTAALTAYDIYLGSTSGFTSGDEVIYTTADGSNPITGLTSGDRYYVIVNPSQPGAIQLAATYADAVGSPGDPNANPPVAATPPNPIPISVVSGLHRPVAASILKVTDQPIGGLVSGVTYYVANATTSTFQLAATATLAAAAASTPSDVLTLTPTDSVSGVVLSGTSTIGTEGVDFTALGTGIQELVIDLTSPGSGTQQLQGVGGARALASARGADGVATAAQSSSGGGGIQVSSSSTTASSRPTVQLTVGSGAALAGNDVSILAESFANLSAVSANGGGGAIALGSATASVTAVNLVGLSLDDGSSITAGHNISVLSYAVENPSTLSGTDGGGVVDFAKARAVTTVTYSSQVQTGSNVTLVAKNQAAVESESTLGASAIASADASGLGANADANNDSSQGVFVGTNDAPALTQTTIGSGTSISAPTVTVEALVNGLVASARSDSSTSALGADDNSAANVVVHDLVRVDLQSGSSIFGDNFANVIAGHTGVFVQSFSSADSSGLGADTNASANTDYFSLSQVDIESGAYVASGSVTINAFQSIGSYDRSTDWSGATFDGGDSNTSGSYSAGRSVVMDGAISLIALTNPTLFIDGNGNIVQARDITVDNGQSSGTVSGPVISVDPMTSSTSTSGTILIETNFPGSFDGQSAPAGTVSGSGGSVNVRDTYDTITITNLSPIPLRLNGIEAVTVQANPAITISSQDVSGLTFTIAHDIGPTTITIVNGTGTLTVAGLIDDPIGPATVTSGGSILEGTGGIFRTNTLSLTSGGDVGSSTSRLAVEPVLSVGRPTELTVNAGGVIYLVLTGRLRQAGVTNPTFTLGDMTPGGTIDLLFNAALADSGSVGNAAGGIAVTVFNGISSTTVTYQVFYHPDPTNIVHQPLDPRLFANLANATPIAGTYAAGVLTAGGNIILNAAASSPSATRVTLSASTDLLGSGHIDATTNGSITLVEVANDLRIDSILSTAGNVSLTATLGSIYDIAASDGTTAWVIGNAVTLIAPKGGIGTLANILEIDSAHQAAGLLTAEALNGVYLLEVSGDVTLATVASAASDVLLTTLGGSILDGAGTVQANVQGGNLDLIAHGGGIGTTSDAVRIDGGGSAQVADPAVFIVRQTPPVGRLYATADNGIYLYEVSGGVNVLSVVAATGDVSITTRSTTFAYEDVNLLSSGATQSGIPVAAGSISAPGSVTLQVADDVTIPAGTTVSGGSFILIQADYAFSSPHAGAGSVVTLAGSLPTPSLTVDGGPNLDFIQLLNPAGVNPVGTTTINGGSGDDRIFIQAISGPTTVNAGAGADRVYVAGNASVALFTQNGAYVDGILTDPASPYPLTLLGGTLAGIDSALTVNLGTGGNDGTMDSLFVSAAGASGAVAGTLDATTITGLGLPAAGSIAYSTTTDGAELYIQLTPYDDTFTVKGVSSNAAAFIYGGAGNDTLNVGNDAGQLTDISGIVAFFGGNAANPVGGETNTLNVTGEASAASGELSAISITLMGMGTNDLVGLHNDAFGAGYTLGQGSYPGAIYYAQRAIVANQEQYTSSVQVVNLNLGNGANRLAVDGTLASAVTTINGGTGNDTFILGATLDGLHPSADETTDFFAGPLSINGNGGTDSLVVNDIGESKPTIGTLHAGSVSGLGMAVAPTFTGISSIELDLGAGGNTFYVPELPAGIAATVNTGSGFDTVYVGTTPGSETTGSLDAIQGSLLLNGQDPQTGNVLFLNDQADTADQSWTISNSLGAQIALADNTPWYFDTTTVSRSGAADILYKRFESVVLNDGQGNDTINLQGTQREQDPSGGHSSTFTINAGAGNDTVYVGAPVTGGYSMAGFGIYENTSKSPTLNDTRGIPVIINGSTGTLTVDYLDTAATVPDDLAFLTQTFGELFPSGNPLAAPGTPSSQWLSFFTMVFGSDPQSLPFQTIALSDSLTTDSVNIYARGVSQILVSLGSHTNVVQFTAGTLQSNVTVYGGPAADTFNIEGGLATNGYALILNGEGGNDLLYVDYTTAVPANAISLTFNGGTYGPTGPAAMLRIAGDGAADSSGGVFEPSASVAYAGQILLHGNAFAFTNVGPMVVDGLTDFSVVAPDAPANLAVGTINVADLGLSSITLHVLTVNGVVAWTQQTQLVVPDALDTRMYGQAVAMSGTTLVVGAQLTDASEGTVYVYTWDAGSSSWVEQAKLYASDRYGSGGLGFGRSVAIFGNVLIVGAPLDASAGPDTGAAYIFLQTNGVWQQVAKVTALDAAVGAFFGSSVGVTGGLTVVVGAPGANRAYTFASQNGTWVQLQELSGTGAFGTAVAGSPGGAFIVIGAPGAGTGGQALLYTLQGHAFQLGATLTASDPQAGEGFGSSVAADVSSVVVGAPNWTDGLTGSQAQGGRAFIFVQSGTSWVREARLTAKDGLPAYAAPVAGSPGEKFGTSVSISGNYVVIGAPAYQGSLATNVGEAYVFYRYTDPTNQLPATWVRSTGATGTGSLGDQTQADGDQFGTSVAVSQSLLVAGVPGFSQTDASGHITRTHVGGIQTFQTNGVVPASNESTMEAEMLASVTGGAAVTTYDPTLRMLFVASANGSIAIYVNEDLFWRPDGTIPVPSNASGFGSAIAEAGGYLAVGAPGSDKVFVYRMNADGTWPTTTNTIYAGTSGTHFGAAVAISGTQLFIGAPFTDVQYSSQYQPVSGYKLDLGATGAVYDYTLGSSAGPQLLMPQDGSTPNNSSDYNPIYATDTGGVGFQIYDGHKFWGWTTAGTYNLGDYTTDDGDMAFNTVSVELGPRTDAVFVYGFGGTYEIQNLSYTSWSFTEFSGSLQFLRNQIWGVITTVIGPVSDQPTVKNTYTGLAGAQWGSSIAVQGSTVVVGAPGIGRVGVYNVSSLNNRYSHWTVYTGLGTFDPFVPYFSEADSGADGSDVVMPDTNHFYSGAPNTFIIQIFPVVQVVIGDFVDAYTTNGSLTARLSSPAETVGSGMGSANTMSALDGLLLAGAPNEASGAGVLYLFPTSGTSATVALSPFFPTGAVDTTAVHFGYGPQAVSAGHYLASSSLGEVYTFRQRGPAWNPVAANDLLVPDAPPPAKVGSSVAIDGSTVVAGAPAYDGRGAVFVFTVTPGTTAGTSVWTYDTLLQSNDIREGDQFGASVGVSGTTIAVGAPGRNGGAGGVYIFESAGGDWFQAGPAIAGSGPGFGLGTSLAISGNAAVVGAAGGHAAVFLAGSGLQWRAAQQFPGGVGFGTAVAMDGSTAVVGAPNAAAVYVYAQASNGSWSQQSILSVPDGATGSLFGDAVAISGSEIAAGAPGAAAVYTFQESAGSWQPVTKVMDPTTSAGDQFGSSVALSGPTLVVGAYDLTETTVIGGTPIVAQDEGAAWVFHFGNGAWSLETVVSPLLGSNAVGGDNVGYSVAAQDGLVVVGAPQLLGRAAFNSGSNAITTSGEGYAYLRSVSPPSTVTYPAVTTELLAGAQANTISGTVGGVATSTLNFFDVPNVTLQTGSADDSITIEAAGLTAYGLQNFTVNAGAGSNTLTVLSGNLTPPLVGQYQASGSFGGAPSGSPLPTGTGYTTIVGAFTFNGSGNDTVIARADTDWTLDGTTLTSGTGGQVTLNGVQDVQLIGGPSANSLTVESWNGTVSLDGVGGSDTYTVAAATAGRWSVDDTGTGLTDVNVLNVLGTAGNDSLVLTSTQVILGSTSFPYAGIETVMLSGQGGNDTLTVQGSAASKVLLDGGTGSDTYAVVGGPYTVWVSDSGLPLDVSGDFDVLHIPAGSLSTTPVGAFLAYQVGGSTVYYDATIEKVQLVVSSPILTIFGTDAADTITVNGSILTINGSVTDLSLVTDLTIDGLGGDDIITVLSALPTLKSLKIDGGTGSNTVAGPDGGATWNVTGQNAGSVQGTDSSGNPVAFSFTNTQNLTGGNGSDQFLFGTVGGQVDGNVDGGGGSNLLSYAGLPTAVTVDLTMAAASGIGGTFSEIGSFVGGSGSDAIVGPDLTATWSIGGASNVGTIQTAGTSYFFSSFENLTGGAADDTFLFGAGVAVSLVVDGGGGDNTLEFFLFAGIRHGEHRRAGGDGGWRRHDVPEHRDHHRECLRRDGSDQRGSRCGGLPAGRERADRRVGRPAIRFPGGRCHDAHQPGRPVRHSHG